VSLIGPHAVPHGGTLAPWQVFSKLSEHVAGNKLLERPLFLEGEDHRHSLLRLWRELGTFHGLGLGGLCTRRDQHSAVPMQKRKTSARCTEHETKKPFDKARECEP
jgi:hypothetical protein